MSGEILLFIFAIQNEIPLPHLILYFYFLIFSQTWSGNLMHTCKCSWSLTNNWGVQNEFLCFPVEGGKEAAFFFPFRVQLNEAQDEIMKKKELLEDLQPDNTQTCKLHAASSSTLDTKWWLSYKCCYFIWKLWRWMSWWLLLRRRMMTWEPWRRDTRCIWRKLAVWVILFMFRYFEYCLC